MNHIMTHSSLPCLALLLGCAAACGLASCGRSEESSAPKQEQTEVTAAAAETPDIPEEAVEPRVAVRSFAEFKPSVNGFRFTNRFKGSPLPISLGGLEKSLGLPTTFGLCGGMSFAAADFYEAALTPPNMTDPPEQGEALYNYLYQRQVASLGETLHFSQVFLEWMALSDDGIDGTRFRTLLETPAIIEKLGAGHPVVLGLVLNSVDGGGVLWENHQVLAYGVEQRDPSDDEAVRFKIYDPNFPGNDGAEIRAMRRTVDWVPVSIGFPNPAIALLPMPGFECVRTAPGRRNTEVRGFFEMPYEPRTPPEKLTIMRAD